MKTKFFIACSLLITFLVSCKKESITTAPVSQPVALNPPVISQPLTKDTILAYMAFVNGQDTVKSNIVNVSE